MAYPPWPPSGGSSRLEFLSRAPRRFGPSTRPRTLANGPSGPKTYERGADDRGVGRTARIWPVTRTTEVAARIATIPCKRSELAAVSLTRCGSGTLARTFCAVSISSANIANCTDCGTSSLCTAVREVTPVIPRRSGGSARPERCSSATNCWSRRWSIAVTGTAHRSMIGSSPATPLRKS